MNQRADRLMGRSSLLVVPVTAMLLYGCGEEQVLTTTRSLARPGPMAMVCAARIESSGQNTGLPLTACAPGAEGGAPRGTLFGIVANTARGDLALFRADRGGGEPLVDLDPHSPGFGFIPVGTLPTDLKSTADGCRVVTANAGSCDLSMIDVPGVLDHAAGLRKAASGGLVSQVVPRTAAGPLRARPQEVLIVPGSVPEKADDATCAAHGPYTAYVTFPRCNLLAEVDLATGLIKRGLVFERDRAVPVEQPTCPAECPARGERGLPDAAVVDAGRDAAADSAPPRDAPAADAPAAVDAGPPADLGAPDGPPTEDGGEDALPPAEDSSAATDGPADSDGATPPEPEVLGAGVLPFGLAGTEDGLRLFVSSSGANFITVVSVDEQTGAFASATRVLLAGPGAQTTRIALSPADSPLGRFLYAIARDRTVRVLAVDPGQERECETNLDLSALPDGGIPLEAARCYAVGAAPRRHLAGSPGLAMSGRLPVDVAFVTSEADPVDAGVGGAPPATPLRGTFAVIAASDGTVYVVDVEDRNFVPSPVGTIPAAHVPHRFRNAAQGLEQATPDAGVARISGQGTGGVPVVVTAVDVAGERVTLPSEGIALRAPGEVVSGEWEMVYEPALAERYSGQLTLGPTNDALFLGDRGADFCAAGVFGGGPDGIRSAQRGDILVILGCKSDDECGLEQTCRKAVARQTEYGLCLDRSRADALFKTCSAYLQQPREFLVTQVERDRLRIDALPTEPQRVILQDPQPATRCTGNSDCDDGFLCALADRQIEGRPEVSVTAGQCFRPGCQNDEDCAEGGSCVLSLDGSHRYCAPVRWPLEVIGSCTADSDCQPATTGAKCETDRDCDPLAECRRVRSDATTKQCVDRGLRCSAFPGVPRACVRPSPCFAELVHYEVRAGRSFIIGTQHRQRADPTSGSCVIDETRPPSVANRLPVGLPVYPVALGPTCDQPVPHGLALPAPNPCFERTESGYSGFVDKEGSAGDLIDVQGPATLLRFANSQLGFSLGLSHLAKPPERRVDTPPAAEAQGEDPAVIDTPAMPTRGLTVRIAVNSGFAQLAVTGAAEAVSLPARLLLGPDGRVYVVDMGDRAGTAGTNGQVLRFNVGDLSLNDFSVK